jgi:site-specific DNA-cytosine methylase
LKVLSLFDGISCALVALKKIGIFPEKYYASEVDSYAMEVAMKNHPEIIQVGDVQNLKGKDFKDITLLVGGSPCQGFSRAGKQQNFDDPRSKLFYEYVRLLKEIRPKYFLLENVKMKKEWIEIINQNMGVEPVMINSSLVSAQSRRRLYWTNIPNVTQPEDKGLKLSDIISDGFTDREKSHCLDANYYRGGNLKSYFMRGRRQLVFYPDFENGVVRYKKLTPEECEKLQTLPEGYTEGISNTQRYKALGNGFTVDVIAHIFKNMVI